MVLKILFVIFYKKTTTNYTTNNNIKRTKDKRAAGFMNINQVVYVRSN